MTRTAVALLLLAGCAGFSPPTPGALARVRWMDPLPGPGVRYTVRIDLESAMISGQFDGVLVGRTGPNPVVRTQCFPDVGPKAIDLVARRTRIRGLFSSGESLDAPLPHSGPPHPILFMGLTLLEHFAPVTEDRVEGMYEDEGDLLWLSLRPVVEGTKVTAALDSRNRVVRRRFEWSPGVRWEEEIRPGVGTVLRAPGMRMSIEIFESQTLEAVPEALFEFKK